ncbi:phytanoyl-CoA dioxygenase family protein [Pedobacter nutrimenti]|jgi:ectoine hydroxylase-related dioxygenase (phytanoyl-CoA dioxygenase family)|uniref:Ectoine hydroxylase-related dioxygenase (Phytanoyl-CoA dioxygenase family) n=1 Tax=Pedobacter nutrimenti TaxID=1241337 RepID=A0A318UEC2_9SPHI|nr:phytanoyl-CoA dioxygenase family protein [Pedobacter nutrimenti]PYF74722.1 ectoine hydroxylase-related dioxygenase (phytanoyl-CoA dioxygenase family) [Pedobacter nutrimenti]
MEAKEIQLPDLSSFKTISAEQIEAFKENGHTLIKGVISPQEAAVYGKVISQAADKYNMEKRKLEDRDTYGKAFLQIMNLWRGDQKVKQFVLAKRFAKIAADLLGVDNVRLYHDQALFKEPGGGPTPWHQDQNYWPLDTNKTITMWMPLVDIPNPEMGMLTFASGSHKKDNVFDFIISDESENAFEDYVQENGFKISRADSMKAGDATFHRGYTIHNAPGNSSDKMREVMTIIYFADGAKVTEPQHKWQENDRQQWLMGKAPGTAADSELNPVLL